MEELSNEEFVRKCWEELTKTPEKSLEEMMGKHNKHLADQFVACTPEQRSIAEYVLKIYAHDASTHRANENERQWRAGVAVSLFLSASIFLFELQRLTHNETMLAVMAAVGAFFGFALGIYVLLRHRIVKWLSDKVASSD